MQVFIPFSPDNPKTRLSGLLTKEERVEFALVMLDDVINVVESAGGIPILLSTELVARDIETIVDERQLSVAVNSIIENSKMPIAIVMGDLAIATSENVKKLIDASGEIVMVPGRCGGTNAFVTYRSDFRVDYHGTSYLDHISIAEEIGAEIREMDSFRLSTDIDTEEDLIEILIHGNGKSKEWLIDAGFYLDIKNEAVKILRR